MNRANSRRSMVCMLCLPLLLAMVACSTPGPAQRMGARLALMESVAGEPVKSFHFWSMHRWEPLGPDHVAVWTRIDTAYLIEVRGPCTGLDFAQVIGLSSTQNRVFARFDQVYFDNQQCRIAQMREIDTKALKEAMRARS